MNEPVRPIGPNEYRCDECGGVFEKGWSDEEAHEEERAIFGREIPVERRACVCDDCFNRIMGRNAGIPGSVFAGGGEG
jgi:hypothetical protein